ncbi:MAG TPA: hypothetical protein VIY73_18850, partial [Polyangiaceae bacterium]
MGTRGAIFVAVFGVAGWCGCGGSSGVTHHGGTFDGGSSGGGGDDGGVPTFSGVTSCGPDVDAGSIATAECDLSMPVQGGLSETIHVPDSAVICGSAGDASGVETIDWGTGNGSGGTIQVTVTFESPLPLDQAGTFPAHVTIAENSGDGSAVEWQTPAGACSIVIAGSVCIESGAATADGGSSQTRRVVSGTGSCTQPASPAGDAGGSGGQGAAVTIGSFAFLSTLGP